MFMSKQQLTPGPSSSWNTTEINKRARLHALTWKGGQGMEWTDKSKFQQIEGKFPKVELLVYLYTH